MVYFWFFVQQHRWRHLAQRFLSYLFQPRHHRFLAHLDPSFRLREWFLSFPPTLRLLCNSTFFDIARRKSPPTTLLNSATANPAGIGGLHKFVFPMDLFFHRADAMLNWTIVFRWELDWSMRTFENAELLQKFIELLVLCLEGGREMVDFLSNRLHFKIFFELKLPLSDRIFFLSSSTHIPIIMRTCLNWKQKNTFGNANINQSGLF